MTRGRTLLAVAPAGLLAVLFCLFVLVDPRIATWTNLRNIAAQAAPVALLALAAFVVLVSGGIDLSAGYAVGLSGIVVANALDDGRGLLLAASLGLLATLGVGVVNGVLIGTTRLPPFVATLGMMTVVQGTTMFLAADGLVVVDDPVLAAVGQSQVLGVPVPVVFVAVVAVVLWALMRLTRFGLRTYAYGSDPEASVLAGVRGGTQLLGVYLLAAGLVFLTALTMIAQVPLVQPNMGGINLLLDAIAAAVLGGTSIFGGRGTVGGVLVGAMIISLVTNALQVLGVEPSTIDLFKGLIIVVAVVLDSGMRRARRRIGVIGT